ncbi:MAG: methyltransferase domain-containing protein [Polyangiaceae bacterium]
MISLRALVIFSVVVASCKNAPTTSTSPASVASSTPMASADPSSAPSTSATAITSAAPSSSSGDFLGRVPAQPMSYQGAWWLDRANRDETQKPEHVLDVMGVHAGQTVADIGCGSGYFSVHLAKRVGNTGRVLATDLQPEMLALLDKKVQAAHLTNITPILATEADAKLPPSSVDIALFVDVYHELTHPLVTMAQVKASLRSGGKVVLVEYRAEDPNVDIKPDHKTTLVQLKRELAAESFTFVASDESLPEQRIVTFVPAP